MIIIWYCGSISLRMKQKIKINNKIIPSEVSKKNVQEISFAAINLMSDVKVQGST